MQKYSDVFQTLHDERAPTGHLGRGTHYSVLRAAVFHGASGAPLSKAQYLDFAVIWDEDHDVRVIEPIEKMYLAGLLPACLMFGERKGILTAIVADDAQKNRSHISLLENQLKEVCAQVQGDCWSANLATLKKHGGIISDDPDWVFASSGSEREHRNVALYLETLNMLWRLGLKKIKAPPVDTAFQNDPLFERDGPPMVSRSAASSDTTARKTTEKDLERAVAYYLYIASKDVPDDEAGLYRAAALNLIGQPVDKALLREAEKRKSVDDALYSLRVVPELEDLWAERAS